MVFAVGVGLTDAALAVGNEQRRGVGGREHGRKRELSFRHVARKMVAFECRSGMALVFATSAPSLLRSTFILSLSLV